MSRNQPLFFYRTLRTFFTHKNHSNHIAIFIFQSNLWASSQIFFELALQRNLSISIKSSSSLVAETNTPGEIHKIFSNTISSNSQYTIVIFQSKQWYFNRYKSSFELSMRGIVHLLELSTLKHITFYFFEFSNIPSKH